MAQDLLVGTVQQMTTAGHCFAASGLFDPPGPDVTAAPSLALAALLATMQAITMLPTNVLAYSKNGDYGEVLNKWYVPDATDPTGFRRASFVEA